MSKNINPLNCISIFASQPSSHRPSCFPGAFRPLTLGLSLTFTLFFIDCGFDIEDPTPPSPPVWVQKSLPEDWPERGIDAHEAGGIYLEWEPNAPTENISEYQIYRAEYFDNKDSLGEFNRISAIEPSSQQITEYIDGSAEINTTYYYSLRAIDQSDNSSEYSDTLIYMVLPQVGIEGMVPDGVDISLSTSRSLRWSWNWWTPLERYTITVVTLNYELIVRDVFLPSNYTGERERWDIPRFIVLDSNKLYKWRVDMGAQFFNGRETAGSESSWATFLYIQP